MKYTLILFITLGWLPAGAQLLKQNTAIIQGQLKNYTPTTGGTSAKIYIPDIFTYNEPEAVEIAIMPDGRLSYQFPLSYAHEIRLELKDRTLYAYCEPGKTVTFQANMADIKSQPVFTGTLAEVNNAFIKAISVSQPDEAFITDRVAGYTPQQYKQFLLQAKDSLQNSLLLYGERHAISGNVYRLLRSRLNCRIALYLLDYENLTAVASKKHPAAVNTTQPGKTARPDSSYYAFLRAVSLNDTNNLHCNDFKIVVKKLLLTPTFNSVAGGANFMEIARDWAPFEPGEREDWIRLMVNKAAPDEAPEWKAQRQVLADKYGALLYEISTVQSIQRFNNKIATLTGLPKGLAMDVLMMQAAYDWQRYVTGPLNGYTLTTLKQEMANMNWHSKLVSYSAARAEERNQQIKLAQAGNMIRKKPDCNADSLFNKIAALYKGKVILLDFWATWCKPCRSDIKALEPVKKVLAGQPVVFVYITDPTSPKDTYMGLLPDIKGEHYYLTHEEWQAMAKQFTMKGIPHRVLVNKAGEVTDTHYNERTPDKVKAKLELMAKE